MPDYVFVDEHNRHKRLKGEGKRRPLRESRVLNRCLVMRACEGCRRRKIKCDAATTNTWPCSACIRLKLQCVPPTINYDRDYSSGGQFVDVEPDAHDEIPPGNQSDSFHQHPMSQPDLSIITSQDHMHPPQLPYSDGGAVYHSTSYPETSASHPDMHFAAMGSAHINVPDPAYQPLPVFPTPPGHAIPLSEPGDSWSQDQFSAASLSDALGQLKIDETGVGM